MLLSIGLSSGLQAQSTLMAEDFQLGLPPVFELQRADASSDGWQWGTALTLRSRDFPIADHGSFMATNEDGCRFGGTPTCNKSSDLLILPTAYLDSIEGLHFAADIYFYGASYDGATESANLLVDEPGLGWVVAATFPPDPSRTAWRKVLFDLSAYAQRDSLRLAVVYNDGGGWPFGMAIDNIELRSVAKLDIGLADWSIGQQAAPAFLMSGPQNLEGSVINFGSDTIQNFRLLVKQGGVAVDSADFTGLSLLPLDTAWISYPNPIAVDAKGSLQKLILDAKLPNGETDAKSNNDQLQLRYGAVSELQTVPREVLLEHFTSTNCADCAEPNAEYHAVLDASPVPANNLSYHVWWPYPTDPFYLAGQRGVQARQAALQPQSAPSLALDGALLEHPSELNAAVLVEAQSSGSPWLLEGTLILKEDGTLNVEARVEVLADHWIKKSTLYAAVSENGIDGGNPDLPGLANSETSFRDVFRRFLPTAQGTGIRDTLAGAERSFQWSWDPQAAGLEEGGSGSGSGSGIDPLERWSLTLFLVDDQTGRVLQSKRVAASDPSAVPTNGPASVWTARVWPNPGSERLWVALQGLDRSAPIQLELFDAMGRRWQHERHAATEAPIVLDLSHCPNGHYSLRIQHAGGVLQRHVQVLR
jgi:hypothetical protein